jgi:hypothetical protein
MSLVRKLPDGSGWVGVGTGKVYRAPRECEQSADFQERQFARTLQLKKPADVVPGSPEWIRMEIEEQALSNIDRALVA